MCGRFEVKGKGQEREVRDARIHFVIVKIANSPDIWCLIQCIDSIILREYQYGMKSKYKFQLKR
jgi:hypothetical protein